jgi:hypothetical protein
LGNSDLVKLFCSPEAEDLLACPHCNYVSALDELDNPHVPCPQCNNQGARLLFPDLPSLELREMVEYFYERARCRVDNRKSKLVNDIRGEVGRTYDPLLLIHTAREIQDFYCQKYTQKLGGEQATHDRMLEIIRGRLSLDSSDQAESAYPLIFEYSESSEEHKVVVILTCTLLENLLADLLVLILICKGATRSEAVKTVRDKLRGFDKRCKEFKHATNHSLEGVITQGPTDDFYSVWKDVRDTRNKFVHENPYAIGIAISEKAFNLAKNAFSRFAYLQNRFCVLRVPASGSS